MDFLFLLFLDSVYLRSLSTLSLYSPFYSQCMKGQLGIPESIHTTLENTLLSDIAYFKQSHHEHSTSRLPRQRLLPR
jgi:hypothetical protein